jgi:hypothetical protein
MERMLVVIALVSNGLERGAQLGARHGQRFGCEF